jgi:anti-anti-sigma regulatory factor
MSERWIGNITIIDLDGRITVEDDADMVLRDALQNLLAQGRAKLVLNLERVPYIRSAGMGRIVHLGELRASLHLNIRRRA